MNRWNLALAALALMTACGVEEAARPPEALDRSARPVVYGEDNRQDVYAHPDEALRALTRRSIVAMVPLDQLDGSDPEDIRLLSSATLGESQDLCEDQRFRDQPRVSNCSATLIDDDLVLTAGHCIGSQAQCERRFFVFDVHFAEEGRLERITQDEVYTCRRLVQTVPGGDLDHAIIQLDRPVTGEHGPAPVRAGDAALEPGDPVILIGFPNQIPAKIADGGAVINPRASTLDYFEATVDAFGGNSGSGVFSPEGEVVGVLVRGEQDYRERGECSAVNVLDEARTVEQGAEDITYVARAVERLCAKGHPSERLCGHSERAWCYTCDADEDCLEGWTCRQWGDAPNVSFCAAPCASDGDCRADHACDTEAGRCQPRRELRCLGGDVQRFDVCGGGRALGLEVECDDAEFCEAGACVLSGPGDQCATAEVIEPVSQTITGGLAQGYDDDRRGSCGGNGPDRMVTFELAEATALTATLSGFDTVLHLRRDCADNDTEVACNDDNDPPGGRGSRISVELEAGAWTLIVDAFGDGAGDYSLELAFGPVCGEPACEPGAATCDEGGAVRACLTDEAGCPALGPPEPCVEEGQACINGRCEVPGEGDTCEDAEIIEPISQLIEGDLSERYRNDHRGACGGDGPEHVFAFTLERPTRFEALSSGLDTVMYLRSACDPEAEIACNDDVDRPQNLGSRLEGDLAPGTWRLFLDTFRDADAPWSLALAFNPTCQDACEEGLTLCAGDQIQTCALGPEGCLVLGPPTLCPEGQRCQEGLCVVPCEDQCEAPATRTCASETDYQLCGLDVNGCLVLGPPTPCPEGRCADGQCLRPEPEPSPEPEPAPVVVADAAPGDEGYGCATLTRPAAPSPTASLLLALALLALATRATRRARR